jgi:hypothetical protein
MPPCDPGRSDFPSPVLTLAFPSQAFPARTRFKRWHACAGTRAGLLASSPQDRGRWLPGAVAGPRLVLGPPSAQGPFARLGCHLRRSDIKCRFEGHYSLFIAHTGSCARPPSSRCLQPWPQQWVFAGCCQPLLEGGPSRRYLCESFQGCLDLCRDGPARCTCPLLPSPATAFPKGQWVGFPVTVRSATSQRALLSQPQSFLNVQASLFACHSGRSYHSGYSHWAAVTFTSEQNTCRYLHVHRIC